VKERTLFSKKGLSGFKGISLFARYDRIKQWNRNELPLTKSIKFNEPFGIPYWLFFLHLQSKKYW